MQFEVRDEHGTVMSKSSCLAAACRHADVLLIATGQHHYVVDVRSVYSTWEIDVSLRPGVQTVVTAVERAVALPRKVIDAVFHRSA